MDSDPATACHGLDLTSSDYAWATGAPIIARSDVCSVFAAAA